MEISTPSLDTGRSCLGAKRATSLTPFSVYGPFCHSHFSNCDWRGTSSIAAAMNSGRLFRLQQVMGDGSQCAFSKEAAGLT